MRKIGLIGLSLALTLVVPASAQQFGVKGGIGVTNLAGADAATLDTETGFLGGVSATFGLSRLVSLQPEVLYVRQGARLAIGNDEGSLRLGFVQVPLLLGVAAPLPSAPAVRPHIFFGPAVGFRVGCDVEVTGASAPCDDPSFAGGFDFKSLDVLGVVGGGFEIEMGPTALSLDARYDFGLTALDNSDAKLDMKSRAVFFTAGFRLPIGSRPLAYR